MRGVPWTGPLEVNSCLSVEEIMIFISEIMWDNYIKLLYLLTLYKLSCFFFRCLLDKWRV